MTLTNCTFTANTAYNGNGGGIFSGGAATLANCDDTGNTTSLWEGELYNYFNTTTLINDIFSGDSAANSPEIHQRQRHGHLQQ